MKIVHATICLFALAGCAAETGYPSDDNSVQRAADPAMAGPDSDEHGTPYTVTEVRIGSDGREAVTVNLRTKPRDTAGLQTKGTVKQTWCDDTVVRLYDKSLTDCAALGCNVICFFLDGGGASHGSAANLGNYCLTSACTSSWNSKVRSYWTGSSPITLSRNYPNDSWKCSDSDYTTYHYANAQLCGQNANFLVL